MTISKDTALRHDSAVAAAGLSHRAVEVAEHHLLAALSRPQPGRERAWARRVAAQLQIARDALAHHRLEVEGPEGLYAELQFEAPWLIPRLHQLAAQLERIEREVVDLASEVGRVESGDLQAIAFIRADATHMLVSLRDVVSKEVDLVYERFNEPAAAD